MTNIDGSSIFSALADRLRFLAARTNVLAENIANADTPGYVARDLAAPEFGKRVASLAASDPRHMTGEGRKAGSRPHEAPDAEASLNGNQVSLETQMMKLSETRMDYQLASTVYRKGVELIRLAVRGGR